MNHWSPLRLLCKLNGNLSNKRGCPGLLFDRACSAAVSVEMGACMSRVGLEPKPSCPFSRCRNLADALLVHNLPSLLTGSCRRGDLDV